MSCGEEVGEAFASLEEIAMGGVSLAQREREPAPLLLKLEDVSKEFPGVKALQGVRLELRAGEVHAVCGENGAGKSTLMKIMVRYERLT